MEILRTLTPSIQNPIVNLKCKYHRYLEEISDWSRLNECLVVYFSFKLASHVGALGDVHVEIAKQYPREEERVCPQEIPSSVSIRFDFGDCTKFLGLISQPIHFVLAMVYQAVL